MATSTTTTLNDLFVNIIREAIFTAQESSLVRNLVTVYDISSENGKTIQVPTYPNVAAAALTEGSDMSSTTVSTGAVTITAAEVGVQAVLTDLASRTAARDVAADIGRVLGEGVAKKMDEDLIALFDGFSTNLGSAGTELLASHFFLANAHLDTANAPGRKVAVIHPKSAYNLKANMTNTFANPNGGDLQNEAMRSGYVGTLGGIDIFESAHISIDGSDDMIGAVFVPGAIGLAIKWDINMEPQRDASLRAWELNATACYGVAELVDGYGVEMKFDAAI